MDEHISLQKYRYIDIQVCAHVEYHLTQYFQDIMVYFGHQFILTPISAQSHPEFYVP